MKMGKLARDVYNRNRGILHKGVLVDGKFTVCRFNITLVKRW